MDSVALAPVLTPHGRLAMVPMTEELEQLLKNLKLRRMLSVYDEQLRAAEKAQTSYSEFVPRAMAREAG